MGRETGLQEEIQNAGKPQASGMIAESTKRLASRYYQLKTGHAPPYSTCTGLRFASPPSAGGASAPRKRETTSSRCVRNGR